MGLIRAAAGAFGGVMGDQWKEFFYCDSLDADTLAVRGQKRVSGHSSNKHGEDNVISNGSVIAVNEGQVMMIVDQGTVVDVCSEAGQYVYDMSSEPSLFTGNLGANIRATLANIGNRISFGGQAGKDQRVYFFNTKEITGNKYGTANPVPFRIVDRNIGLDIDSAVRCNGIYSYRIIDPVLFYKNVCGNIDEPFTRDRIDAQLKGELLTALQPAFAQISAMGVRYSALPAHTQEIVDALNGALDKTWHDLRGIEVASFAVNSVAISPEDEQMIKDLQRTAAMRAPGMRDAMMASATADAMRTAAGNRGGAMMGFMGMNMAQTSGMGQQCYGQAPQPAPQNQYAVAGDGGFAWRPQQQMPQPAPGAWKCPACGTENAGKFCSECGTPRPAAPAGTWKCPRCGAENTGRFCGECGTPRP